MNQQSAEKAVVASAIVVAGAWGYRKLVEPLATPQETSNPVRQLIGLEPNPAPAAQFLVGFGFTYLSLSIAVIAAPELAGAFAILIATGSILSNGAALFGDIGGQVKTANKATPAPKKKAGK